MTATQMQDKLDAFPRLQDLQELRGKLKARFDILSERQGTAKRVEASKAYAEAISLEIEWRTQGDVPIAFSQEDTDVIIDDLVYMNSFLKNQFIMAEGAGKVVVGQAQLSAMKAANSFTQFLKRS